MTTSVQRSQLGNGVRIVSEHMPGATSVALGLWVENGSRFEAPAERGLSHFLEHVFFKGTERRSAAQIAEAIDAVGGTLNAFTGKEYTCYYARVLGEHFPLAADVLGDLLLNATFDPAEVERERDVVLQEIAQAEDTPDDYVHDLFALHYWPGHPLSYPICGTAETVRQFDREAVRAFVATHYRPNRLLVTAAGAIEHETLAAWAAQTFGDLRGAATPGAQPLPQPVRGVFAETKAVEQANVCLGLPGVSQRADERYAAYLLSTALGGGMSSRLFQEIRERRGRAYAVFSFLSSFSDCGYLGVYVGTAPHWVEETMAVIQRELRTLAAEGLTPDELERAKNQLKGNLLLALETSDARMHRIAKSELLFGHDVPPSAVAARIDAVRNDDIVALASRIVRPEAMALAAVGPAGSGAFTTALLDAA